MWSIRGKTPFLFIRKKNCYQYQKRHSRERLFATIFHGSIQLNRKLNQLVAGAKKVVSSEHILFTGMRLNVNTCWPKAEKWQMTNCELTKEILMWWVHQASKANKKKHSQSVFCQPIRSLSHIFYVCLSGYMSNVLRFFVNHVYKSEKIVASH